MEKLKEYRRKRKFDRTQEPAGADNPTSGSASSAGKGAETGVEEKSSLSFVIQKHLASHLHFDLRLEMDGVLKSWAVPKGPSIKAGERRLAVEVEDHPIEYGTFEGTIPKGEYGGGTVMLWDHGMWTPAPKGRVEDGRIDFVLDGQKLQGAWSLIRTKSNGKKKSKKPNWLLIKRSDSGCKTSRLDDLSVTTGRTMDEITAGDPPHTTSDADAKKETKSEAKSAGKSAAKNKATKAGKSAAKSEAKSAAKNAPKGAAKNEGKSAGTDATDAANRAENRAEKKSDAKIDPTQTAGAAKRDMPEQLAPALATLESSIPKSDDWLHEIKFDGYRIMTRITADSKGKPQVRLLTRNGKDWSNKLPTLQKRLERLPCDNAVLDGELVAYERGGKTDFAQLQQAFTDKSTAKLVYQVFDLLYLNGQDLSKVPLVERKALLQQLLAAETEVADRTLRYTDHVVGQGPAFYEQACELGLEGVISKKADGNYPNGRSRSWLKIKCTGRDEFLICGYTAPQGARSGFGALLLGSWLDGQLIYTGKVGTGFNQRSLKSLTTQLKRLEVRKCPLHTDASRAAPGLTPADLKEVTWVKPKLIAAVEFSNWTREGRLRHPVFKGLRDDIKAVDVQLPAEHPAHPDFDASANGASAGGGGATGKGSAKAADESKSTRDSSGKRGTTAADGSKRTRGATGKRGTTAADGSEGADLADGAGGSAGANDTGGADKAKKTARRASTTMPELQKVTVSKAKQRLKIEGVSLSNPQRVLYPSQGLTKSDLAVYYAEIAQWIMPYVQRRPLSLVRCPAGVTDECFFQKHPGSTISDSVPRINLDGKRGLYIDKLADLMHIVQVGALELHTWGSTVDNLEYPDTLVFDLDPAPDVSLNETFQLAFDLRDYLKELGLRSFPRTTGGKGLHLVVPIQPDYKWPQIKQFCRGVAVAFSRDNPTKATAQLAKSKRKGRVFIDYLRNGRGATAIASFSTRARPGAPVAVPIRWDEVTSSLRPDQYTADNLKRRLSRLQSDPWADFASMDQAISAEAMQAMEKIK